MNKRLDNFCDDETIHISYEELCESPDLSVNKIITYCNQRAMKLSVLNDFPKSFAIKKYTDFDLNDRTLIKAAFKTLEEQFGMIEKYNTTL